MTIINVPLIEKTDDGLPVRTSAVAGGIDQD